MSVAMLDIDQQIKMKVPFSIAETFVKTGLAVWIEKKPDGLIQYARRANNIKVQQSLK